MTTAPPRLPDAIPSRPVRWTAVVLACAALGSLAGPALGDAEEPDDRAQSPETDDGDEAGGADEADEGLGLPAGGDPEEGARLYTQLCARCHGPAGRGGEDAPSLRNLDVARMDLVLRTNRMPPATESGEGTGPIDWEKEPRIDLLAYAADTFDLTGSIPHPGPGNPTVGRQFYADNCAACHGYTGDGGVAGGGAFVPTVVGHDAVTIVEAIRVGPFQMPRFGPFQIPDENLADVAAYLQSVHEEEGTPLLGLVELNPVFASGFVAVFALIVLASCMWLGGRVLMFPDPRRGEADTGREPDDRGHQGRQDTDTAEDQEGGQP